MVALYWLENLLFTYWFIKDVFPTLLSRELNKVRNLIHKQIIISYPLSPKMMIFNKTFFLVAILIQNKEKN